MFWALLLTLVIPALWRLRQEDQELEASFVKTCLNQNDNKIKMCLCVYKMKEANFKRLHIICT
jgi:hypothetical protein